MLPFVKIVWIAWPTGSLLLPVVAGEDVFVDESFAVGPLLAVQVLCRFLMQVLLPSSHGGVI